VQLQTTQTQLMTANYSPLLPEYLSRLAPAAATGPIVDLACGSGRNGLYLIEHNIPVVFADINPTVLAEVEQALAGERYSSSAHLATLWPVDLEHYQGKQLNDRMFGGMLVYRYLHRPLFESIKQAVYPGGIVIYETFTVDQPQFGRPRNPDFLLEHGELQAYFSDWDILHSFEGVVENNNGGSPQAIAQIVAIKGR
jgi:tellurite methyltransferase